MNQDLISFVRQKMEQNVSKSEIEQQLLSVGWSQENINQAFLSLEIPSPLGAQSLASTSPNSQHQVFSVNSDSNLSTGIQKLHHRALWLFFAQKIYGWVIIFILFAIFRIIYLISMQPSEYSQGLLISPVNNSQSLPSSGGLISFFIWSLVILGILCVVYYFVALLQYNNYSYEFNDIGLRISRGIISKNIVTIPYERIQSVDISRDIMHRIFGLSSLSIQTAGTYAPVGAFKTGLGGGRLVGLLEKDAESIQKSLVQKYRRMGLGSGL